MRITDPLALPPHGTPPGNTGRVTPVRPPQAHAAVDAERPGLNPPPVERVHVGQLLSPQAIPADWAASARFVGGRAGAVYDRSGNAVHLVELPPTISAYLSHSQTANSSTKLGTYLDTIV